MATRKAKNELDIPIEPYQAEGAAHLMRRPASGLVMDPGTGKTLTVLIAYHLLKLRGMIDVLVVTAPLRPCYEVWPLEVEKWKFPYSVGILHGKHKTKVLQEKHDIYVVNYDGFEWLSKNWKLFKKKKQRAMLVCDESTKVKHTKTKRFKTLQPLLSDFDRRVILTGTPAPKGLLDLFGQVYVLDFGESLGRYITHYRRTYFFPTGFMGREWEPQPDAESRIYKKLAGVLYRVSDEVLGLKKIKTVPVTVTLPDKARKLYDKFEVDMITEIKKKTITAVNAGVLSSKLRQIANGQVYDTEKSSHLVHNEKFDAVVDLVDDLQGNPLLIGYGNTCDGTKLSKLLGNAPMVYGKTKPADAKAYMAAFNRGELPALVCQWDAVAHGLNLQEACHHIGWFGLPWNLETFIQFRKRVHRKGQTKTVFEHMFIANDTVDARVYSVLKSKTVTQDRLLDAIKKTYF